MSDIVMTKATEQDFNLVMQDSKLKARIVAKLGGKDPVFNSDTYYAVKWCEYIMLVTLEEKGQGIYEAHLATPQASIRASRVLGMYATQWIRDNLEGAKGVVVAAPLGKMANMGLKIGYVEVDRDDHVSYMIYMFN